MYCNNQYFVTKEFCNSVTKCFVNKIVFLVIFALNKNDKTDKTRNGGLDVLSFNEECFSGREESVNEIDLLP